jgi:hypothetical protein
MSGICAVNYVNDIIIAYHICLILQAIVQLM